MQLTKAQRATLILQLRILGNFEPEKKEEYEKKMTILKRGYTMFYDEIFADLLEETSEFAGEPLELL
jgi:uncharacterized protein YfbU (UPF0304 family)